MVEAATAMVHIVDDDQEMRESLHYLLRSVGIESRTYDQAAEFLNAYQSAQGGCLVCDVRMPGLSGLDLAERLVQAGYRLPVILMTAYADVPMAVRALKLGAAEFIEKPFNSQMMLERIQRALSDDRENRATAEQWREFAERMEQLTPRESEALAMILEGAPNKTMAMRLAVTERAIEMRRASMMKKLNVKSAAELIRKVTEYHILINRRLIPGT